MPSLLQILTNTPFWVWPVLALVIWLGWRGLRPRILSGWLGALPLVGLVSSLVGLFQSTQPVLAGLGWASALLVALPLGYAIGGRRDVRRRPDGRLEVAGGWFTMVLGLSIFAVRYSLGVTFGLFPALKTDASWIVTSNGIGGAVAGIGLGWIASLVLRGRRLSAVAG